MPRRTFSAGTVTNTTGAPLRLEFYPTSTSNRRQVDLWTIDGSSNLLERIPNGIVLTDASGAYSAFAGPDDVDVLYALPSNTSSRTTLTASGTVTGGTTVDNGTYASVGAPGTRLRAVAIGDSTTAGGLKDVAGTLVQVGNTYLPGAATGIEQAGPQSWFTWACLLSAGRLVLLHNAGVHSDTTTGMLARFQADVLAHSPDLVFIGDAHNDFSGTGGNPTIPQATTRSNIDAMVKLARAAGAIVVLRQIYPENQSQYTTQIRQHNAWLRWYAAKNRLLTVDTYAPVVDSTSATGAWVASSTTDGTHATYAGALAAGQRVLADLGGLLRGNTATSPWLPTDVVQDTQRFVNPLYLTDVNADGKGDSWTFNGTGATWTLVTDSAVIGKAQQCVIASSTASSYQQLTVDGTNLSVGDRVKWAGMYKVTGASGSLNITLNLQFPGVGTYVVAPTGQVVGLDTPWLYFECEAIIPASATIIRPGWSTAAGTGTVLTAQQGFYNMTKLGLV